jgi:hypothetical protein
MPERRLNPDMPERRLNLDLSERRAFDRRLNLEFSTRGDPIGVARCGERFLLGAGGMRGE